MKISFIKTKQDSQFYLIPRAMGMDIYEINEPEEIDKKIEELKQNECKTIVIPDELASFSEKIVPKYQNDPDLKIIILPSK